MNEFEQELDRILDDYSRDVLASPKDWTSATRFRTDEIKQAIEKHVIGKDDTPLTIDGNFVDIGNVVKISNMLRDEQRQILKGE